MTNSPSRAMTSPAIGIWHVARPQPEPVVTAPRQPAHEDQALHPRSPYTAISGGPVRPHRHVSLMREVRRPTRGGHQSLPTPSPQEATMRNGSQFHWNDAARRCAMCEGKFGLIRYYSWRTALCSRTCVEGFKARREGDCKWLRAPHDHFPKFRTPEPARLQSEPSMQAPLIELCLGDVA